MIGNDTSTPGGIATRIAWAERRLRAHARRLRSDGEIGGLLERLRAATRGSHQAMVDAGVVAECAKCEREEGGSCCGAGLEDRYDGVMLLINLLAGTELPRQRADSRSCVFLGPNGCVLAARDVICINYLCQKITGKLPPAAVAAMNACESEEIAILFRLHARIVDVLRQAGDA